MKKRTSTSLVVEEFRQKRDQYKIEEFVLDFILIWDYIHQQTPKLSFQDIKTFATNILQPHMNYSRFCFFFQNDLRLYDFWKTF